MPRNPHKPRNVRNFWISAVIDGLGSPVVGGPPQKDGGFELTIKQRHEGEIVPALTVEGREVDGELQLWVYDEFGRQVHKGETTR